MRPRLLLALALAATLPACVNAHTAQHLETIERLASLRATRQPAPLDPQRSVEVHDCRQLIGPVSGNLYCE